MSRTMSSSSMAPTHPTPNHHHVSSSSTHGMESRGSVTVMRRSRPTPNLHGTESQQYGERPVMGLRSNLQRLPPMLDVQDEAAQPYHTLWSHNRGKWARMIQAEKLHLLLKDTAERLAVERPLQNEEQEQLITLSRVSRGLLQHLQEETNETANLQRRVLTVKTDLQAEDAVIRTLASTVERRDQEKEQLQAQIDRKSQILQTRRLRIQELQSELSRLQAVAEPAPSSSPNGGASEQVTLAKYLMPTPSSSEKQQSAPPNEAELELPEGSVARAVRPRDPSSLSDQTKWLRMLQQRNNEVLDSVFDPVPARPVEHILNPQEKAYEAHRLEQRDLVTNIRCFSPLKQDGHYQAGDELFDISLLVQRSNRLEKRLAKQRAVLDEATLESRRARRESLMKQ